MHFLTRSSQPGRPVARKALVSMEMIFPGETRAKRISYHSSVRSGSDFVYPAVWTTTSFSCVPGPDGIPVGSCLVMKDSVLTDWVRGIRQAIQIKQLCRSVEGERQRPGYKMDTNRIVDNI